MKKFLVLLFLFCVICLAQKGRPQQFGTYNLCPDAPSANDGLLWSAAFNCWKPTTTVNKPPCSASITTNCVPTADASGNVAIAPTLPVTVATTSPQTVTLTGFFYNNSAGAMTFNLPAITTATVGNQYCFRNYVTKAGAITLQAPASTYIDLDGANGTAAGTLVSAAAVGQSVCVVAISTTQYAAYPLYGTWTNN